MNQLVAFDSVANFPHRHRTHQTDRDLSLGSIAEHKFDRMGRQFGWTSLIFQGFFQTSLKPLIQGVDGLEVIHPHRAQSRLGQHGHDLTLDSLFINNLSALLNRDQRAFDLLA